MKKRVIELIAGDGRDGKGNDQTIENIPKVKVIGKEGSFTIKIHKEKHGK